MPGDEGGEAPAGHSMLARSVAVDGRGIVAVSGDFIGTADFGTGPRSAEHGSFLLRAWP